MRKQTRSMAQLYEQEAEYNRLNNYAEEAEEYEF